MLTAFIGIIISVAVGISLFVQTVSLSNCLTLECCCGHCVLGESKCHD